MLRKGPDACGRSEAIKRFDGYETFLRFRCLLDDGFSEGESFRISGLAIQGAHAAVFRSLDFRRATASENGPDVKLRVCVGRKLVGARGTYPDLRACNVFRPRLTSWTHAHPKTNANNANTNNQAVRIKSKFQKSKCPSLTINRVFGIKR